MTDTPTHTIRVASLDELAAAAKQFVETVDPERTVIAFYGEMGAGKTTFINALTEALGVEHDATCSPTFSIVNEYRSDTTAELIYHFDLYRIEDEEEAYDIGVEDYFESGCLCLLEWPEKIEDMLPDNTLRVNIREEPDGSRTITF